MKKSMKDIDIETLKPMPTFLKPFSRKTCPNLRKVAAGLGLLNEDDRLRDMYTHTIRSPTEEWLVGCECGRNIRIFPQMLHVILRYCWKNT
jgi:hypothetical protein